MLRVWPRRSHVCACLCLCLVCVCKGGGAVLRVCAMAANADPLAVMQHRAAMHHAPCTCCTRPCSLLPTNHPWRPIDATILIRVATDVGRSQGSAGVAASAATDEVRLPAWCVGRRVHNEVSASLCFCRSGASVPGSMLSCPHCCTVLSWLVQPLGWVLKSTWLCAVCHRREGVTVAGCCSAARNKLVSGTG